MPGLMPQKLQAAELAITKLEEASKGIDQDADARAAGPEATPPQAGSRQGGREPASKSPDARSSGEPSRNGATPGGRHAEPCSPLHSLPLAGNQACGPGNGLAGWQPSGSGLASHL